MTRFRLQTWLFFSYLLVLSVGVSSLVVLGRVSSLYFFRMHLEQQEATGSHLSYDRNELIDGFAVAWGGGILWSVIIGGTAAGGLSYCVAKRITNPIAQMTQTTQAFAAGRTDERIPGSKITELNQLSTSFNEMAAKLEGMEQRRRELIGDLTHELMTPLCIVEGYLEELAYGGIKPSLKLYQELAIETTRLKRLVNDLQELSKAEVGVLHISVQVVDLYPLLESMVQRFSSQLLDDGPVLQLECSHHLPLVLADTERVKQVLINLLGNAVRYTPKGSITIRSWTKVERLWIAVVDTGHGIAPENHPRVFERFWRSERSRVRYPGGTGIGLTISRYLIELQGGKIEVESQLDHGSTFRFCLPLA